MPQERESDALSAAMAGTDAELFASALGNEVAVHDDTGDRSLEQQDDDLEGAVEDEGKEEIKAAEEAAVEGEVEAAKDGDGADKPERDADGKFVKKADAAEVAKDGKTEPSVPPGRLRETTERAKAAEARETALSAQLAEERQERQALKAQMDLLVRQFEVRQAQQVPPAKTEPATRPDKFADPEGYDKWVEDQIASVRNESREDFTKRLVNMNLANTREVHKEKFDAAYQGILTAAQTEPEARIAIQKIWHSDNPGGELMRWHRDRETLREVGGDPETYRQKLRDETRAALLADPEFRKEMLAGLKADAGGTNGNGSPRHITRVPHKQIPSLNGASGSSHLSDQIDDASEQGLFNSALAG